MTTQPAQPASAEATEARGEKPLYQTAEQDLTCAHPSPARKIARGSNYFSSSRGPMHPPCFWQSIPLG